jgi:hypothetical protein
MAKDSTGVAVSDGKAAVVGLPDEKWGKIVTAFVRPEGPRQSRCPAELLDLLLAHRLRFI